MSQGLLTVLAIRQKIERLPADARAEVAACADQLRATVAAAGDAGYIALALVSAERVLEVEHAGLARMVDRDHALRAGLPIPEPGGGL